MELDESARAENSSANTSYIAATHGHGSSRNLGKVKIKILSVTNAKNISSLLRNLDLHTYATQSLEDGSANDRKP